MKKVLFVINTLGGAGAERALIELLKRFSPDKYETSLYVLMDQGELIREIPSYVKILNKSYLDVSVLSKEGKRKLNKTILKRLFRRGAVWHNFFYLLSHISDMLKKGKIKPDKLLWRVMSDSGLVIKEHYDMAIAYLEGGSTYFVHDHVQADRKYAFLHVDYEYAGYSRKLDKDCYPDFDRIFTVSDEVKKSFLRVYPECESKTLIFHNLIDQEEIRRKALLPGGFEDKYDGKRILTVGRLTEQKAYEIAIDAMKILKDHGVKARWYVLGEGELRNKLQDKIHRLGLDKDFILLGARENPYPYYAQCDLYVHATRFEGKSIAVQEAQVLGCTILVSDCSGNREQVLHGVDGMMCGLTPVAVSTQIELLLQDENKCRMLAEKASEKLAEDNTDVLDLFELK